MAFIKIFFLAFPLLSYGEESYELSYRANSGLLQMGTSNLKIIKDDQKYQLHMDRNISIPGIFKEISYAEVFGVVEGKDLFPKKYYQRRTGRELTRDTHITWENKKANVRLEPPLKTRAETILDIETAENSLDPISSIYVIMHDLNNDLGCSRYFTSFDGVSTMGAQSMPLEMKKIKTKIYSGDAVGCRVTMWGYSGLVMGGSNPSQEVHMDIWLAKPEGISQYIPVIIQSQMGSKNVSLRLDQIR